MFKWLNKFKAQPKAVAPVVEVQRALEVAPRAVNFPRISDYPKSEYKVYWELHVHQKRYGKWEAVLRFYDYTGAMLNQYFYVDETEEKVKEAAFRTVRTNMPDYKR